MLPFSLHKSVWTFQWACSTCDISNTMYPQCTPPEQAPARPHCFMQLADDQRTQGLLCRRSQHVQDQDHFQHQRTSEHAQLALNSQATSADTLKTPQDYSRIPHAPSHTHTHTEKACCAGFRSTRRTKIICTIGPTSCSEEMLQTLAINGMNVARLNLCHGTHEWHRDIIQRIRKLNKENGCALQPSSRLYAPCVQDA